MSWPTAHRVAQIAAVQAHHDLGVSPDQFPVPVASAINAAGLPLMWRPMDQLFGTYLQVGDARGILVNARLTRSGRRHTAAHELGHHRFGHRLNPGSPCTVATGDGTTSRRPWTSDEQAAEAFADWFLMPRKAVRAALACLGLDRPKGPASAYQLSLLLGTSYRATVRHLVSLRMAGRADSQAWASVSPGALKQRLVPELLTSTRDVDAWLVDHAPGGGQPTARHLSPGDQIVIPRRLLIDPGGLSVAHNGVEHVVVTAPEHGVHTLQLASRHDGSVDLQLVIEPRPHGVHLPDDHARVAAAGEATA